MIKKVFPSFLNGSSSRSSSSSIYFPRREETEEKKWVPVLQNKSVFKRGFDFTKWFLVFKMVSGFPKIGPGLTKWVLVFKILVLHTRFFYKKVSDASSTRLS